MAVLVTVGVTVTVDVTVAVEVTVGVAVTVEVTVDVRVDVTVEVGVTVAVVVTVLVTVGVFVTVAVLVTVRVTVEVGVTVAVAVTVAVLVIVRVTVRVAVGLGVMATHGQTVSSSRYTHVQRAPCEVACAQMVSVQAALPHRLNDCGTHAVHAVNVTDQLTAGVQPLLFALNCMLPAPHDSMLAAYWNDTVAPPAGIAIVRQIPLVLFAAPPQAPPPSPE